MATEAQRIVIIQDAGREVRADAVKWTLQNMHVKAGDMIRLLIILQPFMMSANIPATLSCAIFCSKKSSSPKSFNERKDGKKLHPSTTIRQKRERLMAEIAEKQEEIQNSAEIKNIVGLTEARQVDFYVMVEAEHSLKEFTVQTAMSFQATSIIIDRHMKKDQKYLMENLSCAIFRIKEAGRVEQVRESIANVGDVTPESYQHLGTSTSDCRGQLIAPNFPTSSNSYDQQEDTVFENTICSICGNTRPENRHVREFPYSELAHSTHRFSTKSLLSKIEKRTYRGILYDGTRIVVKNHSLGTNNKDEFRSRVQLLVTARHKNVLMLLGSCSEGNNRLLVYEYVCNGSLNGHLSVRNNQLTWERRMKIAMGTAEGLNYLHSNNIYGTVRPSNILLTHDYKPILANAGLTKNRYEDVDHSSDTRALRTFEYLPIEYGDTGIDSSETDIFSLGVLFLELITGRKTIQETNGKSYLRWARPLVRKKMYGMLIDPAVLETHNLHQLVWMVRVVERCISFTPNNRCSIEQVVRVLTDLIEDHIVEDFPLPYDE